MSHNNLVRAARPALIAIPRRLRISPWQTDFWIKEIINLRMCSDN